MPLFYSQLVKTLILKSAVSRSPLCTLSTEGADILPIFITIFEFANFLKTAQARVSIPLRFPRLSSIGHVIIIRKFAKGEIEIFVLLLGVK